VTVVEHDAHRVETHRIHARDADVALARHRFPLADAMPLHFGAWAFYGMDDPNEAKSPGLPAAVGAAIFKNQDAAGMLRFRAGRYAVGVEYFNSNTTYNNGKRKASQVSLSVLYTI